MDLKVQQAMIRLYKFSFLRIREKEEGSRSYEMHNLMHEAVRYGLRVRGGMRIDVGKMMSRERNGKQRSILFQNGFANCRRAFPSIRRKAMVTIQIVYGICHPSRRVGRRKWDRA